MSYQRMHVRWRDASKMNEGWIPIADIPEEPMEVDTVGYLVFENEEEGTVGIASSISDEGLAEGCIVIPRETITSMRKVRLGS